MDQPGAAVVALDPTVGPSEVAQLDPWQLLATGQGVLVRWDSPAPRRGLSPFGPSLAASSELARHVATVMQRAGADVSRLAPNLVSVELPAGSTMTDLIPAVGGGFRGMIRAAGSTKMAGQARLVPVSGAAVAGGAGLAPVLAVMAISVGAEMLARHQQEQKLAAITAIVARIERYNSDREIAELRSAEQAIALGSAALLDRIAIPSSIGLGSACDRVRVVLNRHVNELDRWQDAATRLPRKDGTVDYTQLVKALGVAENPQAFPRTVASLYQATVLDSRAKVLLAAEAALLNPDRPLENLHTQLASSLAANVDIQERLRETLWALAVPRLRSGRTAPTPAARQAVTNFDQTLAMLAVSMSRTPPALATVSPTGHHVLELARGADGSLQPQAPTTPGPAGADTLPSGRSREM